MGNKIIKAHVQSIEGNKFANLSKIVKISAGYDEAGMLSSIYFETSPDKAKGFYIGQEIEIKISW